MDTKQEQQTQNDDAPPGEQDARPRANENTASTPRSGGRGRQIQTENTPPSIGGDGESDAALATNLEFNITLYNER